VAIPKGYLDTCIVSGLVKNDLGAEQESALRRILEARDRGVIEIVTSEVTKAEIDRIHPQHRAPSTHLAQHKKMLPKNRIELTR